MLAVALGYAPALTATGRVELLASPVAPPKPVFIAGRPGVLELALNGFDRCPEFDATLLQFSTRLAAPVEQRKIQACTEGAVGPTSPPASLSLRFKVPDVRAETEFEWQLRACAAPVTDDCPEVGRIAFTAYPEDLLQPIEDWARDQVLRVLDPGGVLSEFLEAREIEYVPARGPVPRDASVVSIIVLPSGEPDPEQLKAALQRGSLILLRERVLSLPMIVRERGPRGWFVDVQQPLVARLATGAAAQKTLLDLFRLSLPGSPTLTR